MIDTNIRIALMSYGNLNFHYSELTKELLEVHQAIKTSALSQ